MTAIMLDSRPTRSPRFSPSREQGFINTRAFVFNLWLTVLAAAVIVATANLSAWQFRRANEKEMLQVQFETQSKKPPLNALMHIDTKRDRYTRVAITGTFDPQHTRLHDNQTLHGRAGVHVVSLFRPSDGSMPVLVNRGWMPLPATRENLAAPAAPLARIMLEGRLNIPAARTKRLAQGADTQTLVQTIELDRLSNEMKTPLAPFIIEQTNGMNDDPLKREWINPDFKIQTHKMYAGQWACFSALAALLWLVLSFPKRKVST